MSNTARKDKHSQFALSVCDDIRNTAMYLQQLLLSGQPAKKDDCAQLQEAIEQINTVVARIEERP